MKYHALLISTIISTLSCAMEQGIEIRDRNFDTAKNPHITIINLLPRDSGFSTRIDISDKTKINSYMSESYKPDDSTKAIYSNQGIRFSPRLNKTGEPDYKRLGMNDAGDAALVALYIYADKESPFYHLLIGKGSKYTFGDILNFTADANGKIVLNHKDDTYRISKTINGVELKIIGLDYEKVNEDFFENNPYIDNILNEEERALGLSVLINLCNAMGIKNCENAIQQLMDTEKTDELDQWKEELSKEEFSDIKDILDFMVPDSDFSDSDKSYLLLTKSNQKL